MGTDVLLLGISALAAILAFRNRSRRRSAIERRLADLGFRPCEADAPALERVWRGLTGGDLARELHVARCRSRVAGLGMIHHFTVREQPQGGQTSEAAQRTASYSAYLVDLRNAGAVSRGAVTLHVAAPSGANRKPKPIADPIAGDKSRPLLEVGDHPWSASIVAALGTRAGRLDDLVPAEIQEKLVRAAAHGFTTIHLGQGKAAFATVPQHADVEDQIAYLAEWL